MRRNNYNRQTPPPYFEKVTYGPDPNQLTVTVLPWILAALGCFMLPRDCDPVTFLGFNLNGLIRFAGAATIVGVAYYIVDWIMTTYTVTDQQIICKSGVILRKVTYMELYRVIDYEEYQEPNQIITGVRNIRICSGDKFHPDIVIKHVYRSEGIIPEIRRRVEKIKAYHGIYEIPNR